MSHGGARQYNRAGKLNVSQAPISCHEMPFGGHADSKSKREKLLFRTNMFLAWGMAAGFQWACVGVALANRDAFGGTDCLIPIWILISVIVASVFDLAIGYYYACHSKEDKNGTGVSDDYIGNGSYIVETLDDFAKRRAHTGNAESQALGGLGVFFESATVTHPGLGKGLAEIERSVRSKLAVLSAGVFSFTSSITPLMLLLSFSYFGSHEPGPVCYINPDGGEANIVLCTYCAVVAFFFETLLSFLGHWKAIHRTTHALAVIGANFKHVGEE